MRTTAASSRALLATAPFKPQAWRVWPRPQDLQILRVWPGPTCLWCEPDGVWHEVVPMLHVGVVDGHLHDRWRSGPDAPGWGPRLRRLFAAIPEDVREVAASHPANGGSWLVLQLLASVPEATEIGSEVPALLALLAEARFESDARARWDDQLRAALSGPTRQLLPLAGLPPRGRILDALRKTTRPDNTWGYTQLVRAVLRDKNPTVRRWLRRLPWLRDEAFRILANPGNRVRATFALLSDPAARTARPLPCVLPDWTPTRQPRAPGKRPHRFRSRSEVEAARAPAFQRWVEMPPIDPKKVEIGFPDPFPEGSSAGAPPLHVRPVLDAAELRAHIEGGAWAERWFQHCLRGATSGSHAFYLARWQNAGPKSPWHAALMDLERDAEGGWMYLGGSPRDEGTSLTWLDLRLSRWVREAARGRHPGDDISDTLEGLAGGS